MVDVIAMMFNLWRGMDKMALSNMGILVHNESDGAFLCSNDTSTCYNGYVGKLMVIDTTEINMVRWIVGVKNTNIITSNRFIGSMIY